MFKWRNPERPQAFGCTRAKRDAVFDVGACGNRTEYDRDVQAAADRDALIGPALLQGRCRIQESFFI
jgi:hypothetical protein